MKTNISLITSMGLTSDHKKVLWSAHVLKAATVSSPAVTISAAVLAIPARPATPAVREYFARSATPAIPANPANPAIAAGALFTNSPAIAAGAAVPAFPAKPFVAGRLAQDAVIAVPGIPAVIAPEIKALPGWSDAIEIIKTPEFIGITAYLPYSTSPSLIGAPFSHTSINEITPSNLLVDKWIDLDRGGEAGGFYTNLSSIATLEQFLYIAAASCATCVITDVVKAVNGVNLPCKKLVISLAATGYDPNDPSLQLSKLNAPLNNYGG
jgi:hypothetical protein